MTQDRQPDEAKRPKDPAAQTGEDQGVIKQRQQTDATMAEKDLARGSEPETRGTSGRRQ